MKILSITLVTLLFIEITVAQNVGIGTVSPPAKLTIQGSNNDPSIPGATSTGILRVTGTSNEGIDIGKLLIAPYSGWLQAGFNGTFPDPISLQPLGGNIGIGVLAPSSSAKLDITSTTQGFLPPRMTGEQIGNILDPAEGLMVYNINSKKPNYFNGSQWLDFNGNPAFVIGDNFKGGKIAYILQSGDPGFVQNTFHGLIAAPTDISISSEWGCILTTIPGTFSVAIGGGNQNTNNITAGCATPGIAARLCSDLTLNNYSDWYLPSLNELQKIQLNRLAIGGFVTGSYWTSSQSSDIFAWYVNVSSGGFGSIAKSSVAAVRAIRSF